MKMLVTAGNTQSPMDQVRCITNIFTGQTGARIAQAAQGRGHDVTLLTSHPPAEEDSVGRIIRYVTFDELHLLLQSLIPFGQFDCIIHSAAVSDFSVAGVYTVDAQGQHIDVQAGKIKSSHSELWLKLKPTIKLVDQIRPEWGFRGILVKFKLEVGITDEELIGIAHASRAHSDADLLVANTLDGRYTHAYICDRAAKAEYINRDELAELLLNRIEALKTDV